MDTDTLNNTLGNIGKGLNYKMASVKNIRSSQRYKIGERKQSPQLMLKGISSVGLMLRKPVEPANNVMVQPKPAQYFSMPHQDEVQRSQHPSGSKEKSNEDMTKDSPLVIATNNR